MPKSSQYDWTCRTCGETFKHWSSHLEYRIVNGRRRRIYVYTDTVQYHESRYRDHKVGRKLAPA